MNRFAWLAACALVTGWGLASALGGCSSDEETPATTADGGGSTSSGGSSSGGSSSGGSSSGTPGDSGNDGGATSSGGASNPGKISCGTSECSEAGAVCCFELSGGGPDASATQTCTDEGDCQGAKLECDEARDCEDFDGGDVCCGEITGAGIQARCKGNCGNNEPQLCKTADECGDGGACAEYTCPVVGKIRACAKPIGCN